MLVRAAGGIYAFTTLFTAFTKMPKKVDTFIYIDLDSRGFGALFLVHKHNYIKEKKIVTQKGNRKCLISLLLPL